MTQRHVRLLHSFGRYVHTVTKQSIIQLNSSVHQTINPSINRSNNDPLVGSIRTSIEKANNDTSNQSSNQQTCPVQNQQDDTNIVDQLYNLSNNKSSSQQNNEPVDHVPTLTLGLDVNTHSIGYAVLDDQGKCVLMGRINTRVIEPSVQKATKRSGKQSNNQSDDHSNDQSNNQTIDPPNNRSALNHTRIKYEGIYNRLLEIRHSAEALYRSETQAVNIATSQLDNQSIYPSSNQVDSPSNNQSSDHLPNLPHSLRDCFAADSHNQSSNPSTHPTVSKSNIQSINQSVNQSIKWRVCVEQSLQAFSFASNTQSLFSLSNENAIVCLIVSLMFDCPIIKMHVNQARGMFGLKKSLIKQSIEQTTNQSVNQSPDQPDQSTDQTIGQSTNQTDKQLIDQPIKQSKQKVTSSNVKSVVWQWVNDRLMNENGGQSVDWSIDQSIYQPIHQSVNQANEQSINQSFYQPDNQLDNAKINQSINQSSKPVKRTKLMDAAMYDVSDAYMVALAAWQTDQSDNQSNGQVDKPKKSKKSSALHSIDQSVNQLTDLPKKRHSRKSAIKQPKTDLDDPSTNQSNNQSENQTINQTDNETSGESINQSIKSTKNAKKSRRVKPADQSIS